MQVESGPSGWVCPQTRAAQMVLGGFPKSDGSGGSGGSGESGGGFFSLVLLQVFRSSFSCCQQQISVTTAARYGSAGSQVLHPDSDPD